MFVRQQNTLLLGISSGEAVAVLLGHRSHDTDAMIAKHGGASVVSIEDGIYGLRDDYTTETLEHIKRRKPGSDTYFV